MEKTREDYEGNPRRAHRCVPHISFPNFQSVPSVDNLIWWLATPPSFSRVPHLPSHTCETCVIVKIILSGLNCATRQRHT
jgi:hypothetical protein